MQTFLANPYASANIGWLTSKIYKHSSGLKLRSHTILGQKIYFLDSRELLHGLHEIFVSEIYNQRLVENAFIIDCGANIGLSVIYLKHLCPSAEIIAFEPDEGNFKLLERNIKAGGFSNVQLYQSAVWDQEGVVSFSQENSMSSRIEQSGINAKAVKAVRLKDFISRKVDFLKLDIEGAEYVVLKDLQDVLFQVRNLFVEYHGTFKQTNELNQILALLQQSGYTYYIKEAASLYAKPFLREKQGETPYDVQLNIFAFRLN